MSEEYPVVPPRDPLFQVNPNEEIQWKVERTRSEKLRDCGVGSKLRSLYIYSTVQVRNWDIKYNRK